MEAGIFPWAPLQDVPQSAPPANVLIHKDPQWQAADPSATVTSPIRMAQQPASPIQMKAPLAAITLRGQSGFLPHSP